MKITIIAAALFIAASGAGAGEAASAAYQLSGTATVASDYIFRGLTQTWHGPAVQGGLDYTHASGLYAGVWASTVSRKVIAGAHAEVDLLLGYRRTIGDWSVGAGTISAFYPGGNWNKMRWGARPDERYDFTELNVFAGYRMVSLKYGRTLNDLFGFNARTGFSGSTRGSGYAEINADIPVGGTGFTLGLHAGRQDIRGTANGIDPDFNDYRISLSRMFSGGWSGTLQVTENSNTAFFNATPSNLNDNDRRDVGRRRGAVTLTKMF